MEKRRVYERRGSKKMEELSTAHKDLDRTTI